MSNFLPDNLFLRGALLHYLGMKKISAASLRTLVKVYGGHALA